tara:strand:- start:529 stop:801 length:273 start_codon:yes stop_codon:yes gene_type:complete
MSPINIDENCQFLKDLETKSSGINVAMWNLITSKKDLALFCKGIKPHRNWRLKNVKKYFGLFDTNGKHKIKEALDLLYEAIVPNNEEGNK